MVYFYMVKMKCYEMQWFIFTWYSSIRRLFRWDGHVLQMCENILPDYSAKVIKNTIAEQVFPESWLQMYCPLFTVRRFAKRGICRRRVSVCLSVCVCVCVRHTPVLYQNG